jgi:NADH dehydrogenase (ubiquinone) 1 alpha subcomplex subunit 9
MPFSPRDEESIVASIQYSDIVVNMIGKYYETKHLVPTRRANGQLSNVNYDFHEVNVEIPRRLARLAKQAGVKSFVHISALSADANSNSIYSRTKAEGEIAVREEFPEAVSRLLQCVSACHTNDMLNCHRSS